MSAISTLLTRLQNTLSTLRAAIWAIDVRDDIADAIEECGQMVEQCYSDVSNPTLQTEALEAALQNKIDQGEMAALTIGDHTITAAKLANGVIPAADATLTETGKPADAAETGRQFGLIKADLTNLNDNVDDLKSAIRDKKYLFVGDSYAEGYSHDGNNQGWCRYLVGYLGLASDKYEIVYHGGWGFANGGYTALLDDVVGSGFTDVVACGGYNDNAYNVTQINSGIETFKNTALGKWPNAKIHIGFIAKNKQGNGTGAVTEWKTKRDALINVVLPTYQKCSAVGCHYLNNVECWLTDDGLTPSDGYHPNADGNQAIAKAIANALITGAAPFPNDKYFTDEIKKALLGCFEKLAWPDDGRETYLALASALRVKISNRREELPDAYEQVEYIRSTREQYIALNDILSAIPFSVSVKASVETNETNTGGYLLSGLGTSTQRFYFVTYTNQKIAARVGNNNWLEIGSTSDVVVGDVYQIEANINAASGGGANLSMSYDKAQGSAVLTEQSISGVTGHALTLFAFDTTGSTKGLWTLYEIIIYSGQTKLFDGIPCYRKSDNKTGIFNAVNNTFYPNATSTEFVTGNVIE